MARLASIEGILDKRDYVLNGGRNKGRFLYLSEPKQRRGKPWKLYALQNFKESQSLKGVPFLYCSPPYFSVSDIQQGTLILRRVRTEEGHEEERLRKLLDYICDDNPHTTTRQQRLLLNTLSVKAGVISGARGMIIPYDALEIRVEENRRYYTQTGKRD